MSAVVPGAEDPSPDEEPGSVRVALVVPVEAHAAFAGLVEELIGALRDAGLRLEPGEGGRLTAGDREVARVTALDPGRRLELTWRPESWAAEGTVRVTVTAEPVENGSRLTVEQTGWSAVVEDGRELIGWFAGNAATPLLAAMAPDSAGDWVTDRQARRPAGPDARGGYRDPLYHHPNFSVILAELDLRPEDRLLEVGCGGGALLQRALESGCTAAGIDHSPDMVAVARDLNRDAIADGRLAVLEGDAHALPFPDASFTCAAMTGVLGFLADPVAAISEIRRVLQPGGRAVVMGTDPENRDTPAAPEPMASRLRFYDDGGLEALGRDAGFEHVEVTRRSMEEYARQAGVPEEHVPLFGGEGARFLLLWNAGP